MSKKNKMEDNGLERTYNINPIGEAADIEDDGNGDECPSFPETLRNYHTIELLLSKNSRLLENNFP